MQEVWQAIKVGGRGLPATPTPDHPPYPRSAGRPPLPQRLRDCAPPARPTTSSASGPVWSWGWGRAGAFILGATFSLLVGQLGMRVAIEGNVRVTAEAVRGSYNGALTVAYRTGTFTGMLTDGLGLLGGTIIFMIFGRAAPDALLGFGFGGTLLALFMRIGGGIYTKSADVGADLVGKVEAGVPEDDPRNAAVVADLVGDNVGDCAGMAADIFESYEVTIVSTLILGIALAHVTGEIVWIVYPLIVRAIGVISSILGTFTVPIWERFPLKFLRARDAEEAMFRSYEVSSVNTVLWSFLFAWWYAQDWRLALLNAVGVGLAVSFNPITSYFTSAKRKPVQEIVQSTRTGSATTVLSGLSVGDGDQRLERAGHLHHDGHLLPDCPSLPARQHPCAGRAGHPALYALRRGDGRHRDALPHRQQRGDGLLRPHRRQRQRHRRDSRRGSPRRCTLWPNWTRWGTQRRPSPSRSPSPPPSLPPPVCSSPS
jgi:hypothetical protein